jgi:hypothetical protein
LLLLNQLRLVIHALFARDPPEIDAVVYRGRDQRAVVVHPGDLLHLRDVALETVEQVGCEELEHTDIFAVIDCEQMTTVREFDLLGALDLRVLVVGLYVVGHKVAVAEVRVEADEHVETRGVYIYSQNFILHVLLIGQFEVVSRRVVPLADRIVTGHRVYRLHLQAASDAHNLALLTWLD